MQSIDAIIPARNEAATVADVVSTLKSARVLNRIIVIDNDSSDQTADKARAAGAEVIHCPQVGLGYAMKAGIQASRATHLFRTDADIDNWNSVWMHQMIAKSADIVRAYFESPYDDFPVTRLVAEPLWELTQPDIEVPPRILSGTYLFPRNFINFDRLCNNWAFDISLYCLALDLGLSTAVVDIGYLSDRQRPIEHYVPMARDIIEYMLARREGREAVVVRIELSAAVGSNVDFRGQAYVGHNCVLGGIGFQHSNLLDLYLSVVPPSQTVLGDGFVILSSSVVGAGTVIGSNFRGDAHILIGEDSVLGSNVVVEYGARVYDRVKIGNGSQIGGFVCNDSTIGAGCIVQGSLIHARTERPPERAPVIEDGALVGTNATIVGNVVIGQGSLVAAGAVVTKSTDPGYLYAGVPARRHRIRAWV